MIRRPPTIGLLVSSAFLLCTASVVAQDWPQWRGPKRDGKVTGFTAPASWPKTLTKKWTVNVGSGVSSPVLVGDRLYTFGRIAGDEVTMCVDADSGKIVWRNEMPTAAVSGAASGYGGPRSTPAVADGKICTLGVDGTVSCLEAASGKPLWQETNGAPRFATSTSPLIADGKCIVFVDALAAFDLASGKVKWKGPKGAPYGSPVLMSVDGVTQVVTPTANSLVGVSLADGKTLWQVKLPPGGYSASYGTPIIDGQTVIFYVAGGRGGPGSSLALHIEKKGDGFAATEVWKGASSYGYNTPVLNDSLLFGLSADKTFFCTDAKNGKVLWTDTTARGEAGGVLNAGSVILAVTGPAAAGKGGAAPAGKGKGGKGGGKGGKGRGFMRSETASADAELVAFEASNAGYKELARYTLSPGTGLTYPIVAGNRVYVKGNREITLWTIE